MSKKVEQGIGSNEAQEPTNNPEGLQERLTQLQNLENGQYPGWQKPEDIERLKEKLRAEIEEVRNGVNIKEEINSQRKNEVVERFGPEVLKRVEQIGKIMAENVEVHLTKTDKTNAEEILKLWEELGNRMNAFLVQATKSPDKHKEAIQKATRAFDTHYQRK